MNNVEQKLTAHFNEVVCEHNKQYIELAHRTASDKFYGDRISFDRFNEALQNAITSLRELDRIKKSLFYGKGHCNGEPLNNCNDMPILVGYNETIGTNIIHGILGAATETGEMLELLYATVIDGKSFDAVNMGEEVGDVLWYFALLAEACGFTFEGVQEKNIAKLMHRFPEKFSEANAINRDLNGERHILEGSKNGITGMY